MGVTPRYPSIDPNRKPHPHRIHPQHPKAHSERSEHSGLAIRSVLHPLHSAKAPCSGLGLSRKLAIPTTPHAAPRPPYTHPTSIPTRHIILTTLLQLFLLHTTLSQPCQITIQGQVTDQITHQPLPYTQISIPERKDIGTIADSQGHFTMPPLCPGKYHLQIQYTGYHSKRIYLGQLHQDTTLTIQIHQDQEILGEVIVTEYHHEASPQTSSTYHRSKIIEQGHQDLALILENTPGVSTLSTGAGVSKPIVHGLFGNRIAIFNHGIQQAGQQWGNDHAPEIDPYTAQHISVLKGASSLEYGSRSLGGVIIIESEPINPDPHLHGSLFYTHQTNGRGHIANLQLESTSKLIAWRINGTWKHIGDRQTPDYYLHNTGKRERSLSIQLEKKLTPNWDTQLYYSYFQSEIGILRGAQIGNLTDLEQAIGRPQPFYTQSHYSDDIDAPRQWVGHHLLKLELHHHLQNQGHIHLTYGGQINTRDEYDVRRGNRSDQASLSLSLLSHSLSATYHQPISTHTSFKSGLQLQHLDNENQAGTNIAPLIPDYESSQIGAFAIYQIKKEKWLWEAGARYDFRSIQVVTFTRTLPTEIIRYHHPFHQYSASTGAQIDPTEQWQIKLDLGLSTRPPEVNELHSFGLHQGTSGIEEGSTNLRPETSTKAVSYISWAPHPDWDLQVVSYAQRFWDYIYLQPQPAFRLTIRGAFPVYRYEQTDATLLGSEWQIRYRGAQHWQLDLSYAMIRGYDLTNSLPLIFMPPDYITLNASYHIPIPQWQHPIQIKTTAKQTFHQWRLEPQQDFLPPPDGYFLLSISAQAQFQYKTQQFIIQTNATNLLNQRFRSYLDRQRYFADNMGRNINLGLKWLF